MRGGGVREETEEERQEQRKHDRRQDQKNAGPDKRRTTDKKRAHRHRKKETIVVEDQLLFVRVRDRIREVHVEASSAWVEKRRRWEGNILIIEQYAKSHVSERNDGAAYANECVRLYVKEMRGVVAHVLEGPGDKRTVWRHPPSQFHMQIVESWPGFEKKRGPGLGVTLVCSKPRRD